MNALGTSNRQKLVYVTSSPFKRQENEILRAQCELDDGRRVDEVFEFAIRELEIKEILETDISVMVQAEVANAYSQIKVPCVVEHAGLIFEEYRDRHYPGGLTKPMWNTLQDRFLDETASRGRHATARAVVAYCDGMSIRTFIGETSGHLSNAPRGNREFYWDTVFIPDDPESGTPGTKTYAEIVAEKDGLAHKVIRLSQSTKAMLQMLNCAKSEPLRLWRG